MLPNFLVLLGCSLIPFFVAFIWFNPNVFGGEKWAEAAGLTPAQANSPVKPFKLFLSIILNFFLAFGIYNLVVHQGGVFSLVGGDPELPYPSDFGLFS